VQRMKNRGNNEKFIELIEGHFEEWIDDLDKQTQFKIILDGNEYLSDRFQK
jgi:hypothetical protein